MKWELIKRLEPALAQFMIEAKEAGITFAQVIVEESI